MPITFNDCITADVLSLVYRERHRQDRLRSEGKFPFTCASRPGLSNAQKLAVLTEEVGEVAREICESVNNNRPIDRAKLQAELTQVAAIAVAWLETVVLQHKHADAAVAIPEE